MQEVEQKEKYCYRMRKVRIKIERKIIFRGFPGLTAVAFKKKKKNPAGKISRKPQEDFSRGKEFAHTA